MTDRQAIELVVIMLALSVGYWWLWKDHDRGIKRGRVPRSSATYDVAYTGSTCVFSFDPWVERGSELFIPAADGCYGQRVKPQRGYKIGLEKWMAEFGATIHVIITAPTGETISEWQPLKDRYPTLLRVYLFDREKANPELKQQIAKLDTFHPVLLVNPRDSRNAPGAMYIEPFHPINSKYAYNVRFSNPTDTANSKQFSKYREMYETLLHGPHVTELKESKKIAA